MASEATYIELVPCGSLWQWYHPMTDLFSQCFESKEEALRAKASGDLLWN